MYIDPTYARIVERIANRYFNVIVNRMEAIGARKAVFGLSPAREDMRLYAGWEQELTPETSDGLPLKLAAEVLLAIDRKGIEHAVRLDPGEFVDIDHARYGLVIGWTFVVEDRSTQNDSCQVW